MRLALIAYLHGAGGAERQITMLANAMVNRGHEVYFFVLAEFNQKYQIDERVQVYNLAEEEKRFVHPIIGRYMLLKKYYKIKKPDITIHYTLQSAYLTAAMRKKVYGKSIYSERGDPYDKEYDGLLGIIRDWCVRHTDAFVFQSEGAQAFFSQEVQKRSVVIHNSVSVPYKKYSIPEIRDNRIISVGRLHEQKNLALLIKAFEKIANDFPELVLVNYGDGELREQLQNFIDSIGMSNRVSLLPSCKDIYDTIRTGRLFVLSSDYEGMPNALLEAMALGMPCISTDCRPGGARALITDGENGFIVPIKDEDALADKMRYVLSNSEIADKIAANAQLIADTHTEEYVFDKWEQFIKDVKDEKII